MTELLLVDLSGSARNRRFIRNVALAYLRWLALLGREHRHLLVFAPRAEGLDLKWPGAPRIHRPSDLLDEATIAEIDAWVLGAGRAVVDADGRQVDGIHLAQLNLTLLHDELHAHAMLSVAMRRLLTREKLRRWTVLSADLAVARAIATDLALAVPTARRSLACRLMHAGVRFFRGNQAVAAARPVSAPPSVRPIASACASLPRAQGSPDVVILEESRPIAGMGDALAPVLRAAGQRVLRLRTFANAEPVPDGLVVAMPASDATPWNGSSSEGLIPPPMTSGYVLHPDVTGLLKRQLHALGGDQAAFVRDLGAALDALRPRLLLVGNDRWWVGQAAVRLAARRGIRTVVLQDGIMFALPRNYWMEADVGLLNGGQMQEALVANGVAAERLRIVGQPRYDQFERVTRSPEERRTERRRYGLSPERRLIMVATQPDQAPEYARQVTAAIIDACDADVLLRPHPSMDAAPFEAIVRDHGSARVRLDSGWPLNEVLPLLDLLVIQNSTLGVEAALVGVPVISCNLTGLPDLVPYGPLGIATAVDSLEALRVAVAEERSGEVASAAALEYLVGPLDGAAAERVVHEITKLLRAGNAM